MIAAAAQASAGREMSIKSALAAIDYAGPMATRTLPPYPGHVEFIRSRQGPLV